MLNYLSGKKVKILVSSISLGAMILPTWFFTGFYFKLVLLLVSLAITFVLLIWSLELLPYKKLWFNAFILPSHIVSGALLSFLSFPNLSILMKLAFAVAAVVFLYISLLVNNVFVVVQTRGRSIPLYRVAVTWVQILIVVASIPFFTAVFKANIHPLLQMVFVSASAYSLFSFFLTSIGLEEGTAEVKNLPILCTLWVLMLSVSMLFIPFEALFRGLFLSSIVLSGLGFIQNYLKHTLNRKIILEHIIITISFLILGLLFIP